MTIDTCLDGLVNAMRDETANGSRVLTVIHGLLRGYGYVLSSESSGSALYLGMEVIQAVTHLSRHPDQVSIPCSGITAGDPRDEPSSRLASAPRAKSLRCAGSAALAESRAPGSTSLAERVSQPPSLDARADAEMDPGPRKNSLWRSAAATHIANSIRESQVKEVEAASRCVQSSPASSPAMASKVQGAVARAHTSKGPRWNPLNPRDRSNTISPVRRLNPLRKAYRSFLDPFSKRRRDPFAASGGARKSEVAITTNQLAAVDLSANSGRLSVCSDASELSVSGDSDAGACERALAELVAEEQAKVVSNVQQMQVPPNWWMMHPQCGRRQVWDHVMLVVLSYEMLAVPLNVAFMDMEYFQVGRLGYVLEWMATLCFCLDALCTLCTGVFVDKGKLGWSWRKRNVAKGGEIRSKLPSQHMFQLLSNWRHRSTKRSTRSRPSTRAHAPVELRYDLASVLETYVTSGGLLVDLFAIVPWELVLAPSATNGEAYRSLDLLKVMRLSRLLKVLDTNHMGKAVLKWLTQSINCYASEVIGLMIYLILLVHYSACGFICIHQFEQSQISWSVMHMESYGYLTADSSLGGDAEYTNYFKYLAGIYWAFTTISTVGYGDIVPYTEVEKMYAIGVMFGGVIMMSFVSGRFITLIANYFQARSRFQEMMQLAESYCGYRNLPEELYTSVLEYFRVHAAHHAISDEGKVLSELSPPLKARVVCFIFQDIIASVPLFRGSSDLFLSAVLTSTMAPILFAPSDIIIHIGQVDLSMYILKDGHAVVLNAQNKMLGHLYSGDFCGEIGLFFGVPRSATIVSIMFCDTFRLSQEAFESALEKYPEERARVTTQTERMFQNHIRCYTCQRLGHISIQCRSHLRSLARKYAARWRRRTRENRRNAGGEVV